MIFEGPKKYVDMLSSKIERLRNTKDKPASDGKEETKEPIKAEATAKVVEGNTEDKPASDDREETKEPVKTEATMKVVDLTQKSKRPKLCCVQESEEASTEWEADENCEWVQIFSFTLKVSDRALLLTGKELTDMHINAAHKLLLYQFPSYQGLHNTLVQHIGFWVNNYIQIWHCCQCHWITLSTIGCKTGEVNIYDSLYSDMEEVTKCKVQRVFGSTGITMINFPNVQKQVGLKDCGSFAIAFATSLAFGQEIFEFQQDKLLSHLKICFEQKYMEIFP